MPRFIVDTKGEAWQRFRAEIERIAALASSERADLNQLGKALAALMGATLGVFDAAGLPSVRMRAAAKALDLATPKSELERFTGS